MMRIRTKKDVDGLEVAGRRPEGRAARLMDVMKEAVNFVGVRECRQMER